MLATGIKVTLRFVLPSQDKWGGGGGSPLHSCLWVRGWGKGFYLEHKLLLGPRPWPLAPPFFSGLSDLHHIVFPLNGFWFSFLLWEKLPKCSIFTFRIESQTVYVS